MVHTTKLSYIHTAVNIGFEQTLYSVQEDAAQLKVCVVIEGATLARSVELTISSSNGTAQAPQDYAETFYSISYLQSDGERKCINITIVDDDIIENTETFSLRLASVDVAVSVISDELTVTILDDDQVTLALRETNYTVNESAGQLQVMVELKGNLERSISFSLNSNDGTASALGGDYTTISDTLSFPSGSKTGSIISFTVDIHDDLLVEGQESFSIQASSADEAVVFEIGKEIVFIAIEDDDCKWSLQICMQLTSLTFNFSAIMVDFVSPSYSLYEGEEVEVCVMLKSGQLGRDVQLQLLTQDDTAAADVDYIMLNFSFLLKPGDSQKCFSVVALDDSVVEGEEVFQAILSSSDPAVVMSSTVATDIYIQDSDSKPAQLKQQHKLLSQMQVPCLVWSSQNTELMRMTRSSF